MALILANQNWFDGIRRLAIINIVRPERRNPRLATVEGFEGRTTEIAAPLLGRLYSTHVTNSNTDSVTFRNTLRLTKLIAAGRKLAQTQIDLGLNRPPLTAKKRGQSRKVDTKGTRPSARMAMVLQIRSWRGQAKQASRT